MDRQKKANNCNSLQHPAQLSQGDRGLATEFYWICIKLDGDQLIKRFRGCEWQLNRATSLTCIDVIENSFDLTEGC